MADLLEVLQAMLALDVSREEELCEFPDPTAKIYTIDSFYSS